MRKFFEIEGVLVTLIRTIGFIIGCIFLYWAVQYYVLNNFDGDRYEFTKLQSGGSDTLSVWKLDRRTGQIEYCSKQSERFANFVCIRPVQVDAKDYTNVNDLQRRGEGVTQQAPTYVPVATSSSTGGTLTAPNTSTSNPSIRVIDSSAPKSGSTTSR